MAKLIDLKDLKTVSMYKFSSDNKPTLEKLGEVEVSGLKEDGELATGTYKEGTSSFTIKGRAYKYKKDIYLTFSLVSGTDTFLGRLIFESGSGANQKLMVVGTIFSEDRKTLQLNQEEQAIVITKP